MLTAIHLGFSNIPRSLTLAIQLSKHSHRLQKARWLTVSEDYPGGVDRVARGGAYFPRMTARVAAMSSIRETLSEPFGRVASLMTSILSAGSSRKRLRRSNDIRVRF